MESYLAEHMAMQTPAGYVVIALLGLIFGSFCTAAAYRIPRGQNFITARSKCPSCHHVLGIRDLFPLFSWLWLRGKCRYCGVHYGGNYLITELGTALLFVGVYSQYGFSTESIFLYTYTVLFVILSAIDFEHYIIPDGINLSLFLLGLGYLVYTDFSWQHALLGPTLMAGLAYLLRWVVTVWKKQEALGLGDVKFFAVAGIFLDVDLITTFLFGSGMIGMGIALMWTIWGKGTKFPFGPALAASLYVCLVWPDLGRMWQEWVQAMLLSV